MLTRVTDIMAMRARAYFQKTNIFQKAWGHMPTYFRMTFGPIFLLINFLQYGASTFDRVHVFMINCVN